MTVSVKILFKFLLTLLLPGIIVLALTIPIPAQTPPPPPDKPTQTLVDGALALLAAAGGVRENPDKTYLKSSLP